MPDVELRAELDQIVQLAVKLAGARLAFVALGTGVEATIAAHHGDAPGVDHLRRFAEHLGSGAPDRATASWLPAGIGAFLAEPVGDRAGLLCVAAEPGHQWGGGDSAVVQRLAQLCAAQLRHHSRMTALVSRERTASMLAAYAADLAAAASAVEVVAVIGAAGRALLDAPSGSIAVRAGNELRLTDLHQVDHAVAAEFAVLDVDDSNPISQCVARNRPIYFASRAELVDEFPHLEEAAQIGGHDGYAIAPLADGADVFGAVSMMWDSPRQLLAWERTAVSEFGRLGGRALRRLEAADEAATLAGVEADLGAAPTVAEVAEIVADRAVKMLGAATVQLATVDGEHLQMIASWSMVPDEEARYQRILLSESYPACAAIRGQRTIVLDDELSWQRWPNALVTRREMGADALVVVPMPRTDSIAGVLAISFARRNDLGPRQRRLAERFAAMAGRAVERAQLLDGTRNLLERQRTITARLQRSLLPAHLPEVPGAELAATYQPAEHDIHVGGDWYDAFVLADGRLMLTIGDVVGKGVDAAGASGQLRSAMHVLADTGAGPAEIIGRLDRFASWFPAAWAATALCLAVNLTTGAVQMCRAGHIPPLVVTSDGTSSFHEADGSAPLGIVRTTARPESNLELGPGDLLVLCTDGLVERPAVSLDDGLGHLAALATQLRNCPDLVDVVMQIGATLGDPHATRDDVCIVALRRNR